MSDAKAAPNDGDEIVFLHEVRPALQAGEYAITVRQHVKAGGKSGVDETFAQRVPFAVAAQRFRIEPSDFDSAFPVAGTQGDFANVLPHVVLKRATLPWERSPIAGAGPERKSTDGGPSWLGLLVFDERDPPPELKDATVGDLVKSAGDFVTYSDLEPLEWGQQLDDRCQIIDVPKDLFNLVAPSIEELNWLAHVRRVTTTKKANGGTGTADYAVVIANRLPRMGAKTTVHLVSLEGMGAFLPTTDGSRSERLGANERPFVRLLSLFHWSFDTLEEHLSFASVLERVGDTAGAMAPSLPPASGGDAVADKALEDALAMGYMALPHFPREGGVTASWYRGPLVPYPVTRTVKTPIASSDAAMRYDPGQGLFDVSYAAAWQLGRLLMLQSQEVAVGLTAWKKAQRCETIAAFEEQILAARVGADESAPQLTSTLRGGWSVGRETALGLLKTALRGVGAGAQLRTAEAPRPQRKSLRANRTALMRALGERALRATAIEDEAPPVGLSSWFARLRRLEGVPYRYLVADEAMLEAESIRFFYLDPNWVDCLVDGAYSIGRATASDLARDEPRHLLRGSEPQVVTGLLLRSMAVSGWPGLELTPRDQLGNTLNILRSDRLAPTVLLCLFDGAVASVDLHEPPEGVHFGFDVDSSAAPNEMNDGSDTDRARTPPQFVKSLRDRRGGKLAHERVTVRFRAGDARVVRIGEIAAAIRDALGEPVTAAEFALELVEGVGLVTFVARVPNP